MRLAWFRPLVALIALAPLAAPSPALAQGEAQQLPPSTAPTAAPTSPQVSTPVALPVANVSDPMLVPVPPAEKVVMTWREALALLRSRSTDLRTAYDEIRRAEAQQRIALANDAEDAQSGTRDWIGNGNKWSCGIVCVTF